MRCEICDSEMVKIIDREGYVCNICHFTSLPLEEKESIMKAIKNAKGLVKLKNERKDKG